MELMLHVDNIKRTQLKKKHHNITLIIFDHKVNLNLRKTTNKHVGYS